MQNTLAHNAAHDDRRQMAVIADVSTDMAIKQIKHFV